MKEYTYQLEKEDYREWIRWNIKKHDQRKAKLITVGVMLALLAVTLIGNFSSGRPIAAAIGSVVTFIGLGAIMLYFISPQNQEKMIWKKSGLKKMEKTGFPTINWQCGRTALISSGLTGKLSMYITSTPAWRTLWSWNAFCF
ncbi:hypothetical protein CL3_27640 [butyrate-producing bacterium SM4/1]|nr:hypothetical protein CL3_27640 [butyrate-producing bacterium SM4/1]